jgi:hypothetical protein
LSADSAAQAVGADWAVRPHSLIATLRYATLRYATQRNATQRNATQRNATLRYVIS